MKPGYRILLAAFCLSSLAPGAATLAQDAQTSGKLEEVTVTARRVKESMQEVPVSISAFTEQTLERRQIVTSDDIAHITPNLEFTDNAPLAGNNNSSVIFIRGVGQISPRANVDPGVGLYMDGVYMGQSVGGSMELRDIAGVQVLRGPQGTLFGRNTIGGAILLNTTSPGDEFGGKIRVGAGEYSLFEVFGAVDIPISEALKTRFTAGTKQQDGYVTRLVDGTDLGDINNSTITAKADYEPGGMFSARFNFDYTTADENGAPLVFAGYNNNTDFADTGPDANPAWMGANQSVGAGCGEAWVAQPGPPGRPVETAPGSPLDVSGLLTVGGGPRGYTAENTDPLCANNQWNAGPWANNGTAPVTSTMDNWGLSATLEWVLSDAVTLKSITAYREIDWTGQRDGDNTPFTILHTDFNSDGNQFSEELQMNFETERVTGVAGLYYYQEEVTDILTPQVGDRGPGTSCGPGTDRCHLDSDNNITDNESWAVFGQVSYHFTDTLVGTFGARYTDETKASIPDQFDYADPDNKYLPNIRYEEDFSATTISASLAYNFADNKMVYASYSEGFKGGGWNSTFNFPLTPSDLEAGHSFDQEEVETIEIGLKSDLSDTFRLNAAIFSSDYTDLQFTYRVFIAPWFFNAGTASIDGGEVDFTWVPTDQWTIQGGVGFLDATIDDAADIVVPGLPVNTSVEAGNALPYAPDLQWNLGISYRGTVGSVIVTPAVNLFYSDRVWFDAANTVLIAQQDSYTLLDFAIAVEPAEAHWKVTVGVTNATDEAYRVSGNSSLGSGTGYAETAYARPRTAYASLTYMF